MKKNSIQSLLVLVVSVVVLFSGCATIMNGTSQKIGVSSVPTGAKVTVDNIITGVTPMFASLSRKDTHIVKIDLAGYAPAEFTINKKVSGWVWGNIIFGGLIGLAVDAISGGVYALSPDQINAELTKNQASMLKKGNCIYLATVLKADPNWRKIGQMEKVN